MPHSPSPAETHPEHKQTEHHRFTEGGIYASTDAAVPLTVPASADPGCLKQTILDSARRLHESRYLLITSLAAYDHTGHWAFTGARTCAHWLANCLGIHVGTARGWLRIGQALESLPLVAAAMADARLSYCAVRSLTRVVVDHTDHEEELVALAERTAAGDLSRALAGWALGHDSDDQRDERDRRDTHLSARIEPDGMGTIHLRLPAIELSRIQAAVDARVMQSTRSNPEHPNPSLGHQRAMALVELTTGADSRTRTADDAAGRSAAIKVDTEIIVHVRGDGATMHDGTPIADSTVASLLDESLIRMLIHDAENRPVNASVRRRHPTTRQKRVVDERDPRCVDCGGTELLEYDHQPPYRITKRTHTDELTRRCHGCHTLQRNAKPK